MSGRNGRRRAALLLGLCLALLCALAAAGPLLADGAALTDLARKNLPPGPGHLFGTDQLGRDMLARTLAGLSLSLGVGLAATVLGGGLALVLGLGAATLGPRADGIIGYLTDLMLGVPHMLLLILAALAFGRGFWGVLWAMALTHWPTLARVLRGEALQLRGQTYIQAARQLGMGRWQMARRHYLPHLMPQFCAGAVLILPHAMLHEAALTFLGFGLSPETPAIGVILSESMGYLAAGRWWLAALPGGLLVAVVALLSGAAEAVRRLTEPGSVHL